MEGIGKFVMNECGFFQYIFSNNGNMSIQLHFGLARESEKLWYQISRLENGRLNDEEKEELTILFCKHYQKVFKAITKQLELIGNERDKRRKKTLKVTWKEYEQFNLSIWDEYYRRHFRAV